MYKKDFIDFIATKVNKKMTKVQINECIELFIESVSKALSQGEDIILTGFGKFYTTKMKARDGNNPLTGKKMKIKAYNKVSFKAGKKLKTSCN